MKNQILSLFAVLVLSLCGSCEGPQGEPGPAGPQGDPGPAGPGGQNGNPYQGWTYKEGFVKATATSTLLDGTPYSYDLNFQGNFIETHTYALPLSSGVLVQVNKYYAGEGELLEYGYTSLSFIVPSLDDVSNPTDFNIYFKAIKDLGNHKAHLFDFDAYEETASVSNLTYDPNTNIITGNFTVNIPASVAHGPIIFTNASFSAKLSLSN